jgi:DNA processing protein
MNEPLSDEERISWLRLSRSENIGPVTFRSLMQRFGSASAAITNLPELAKRGGKRQAVGIYPKSAAEDDIERAASVGASFVTTNERGYPPYLRHIHAAPPLICVAGNLDLAPQDAVAIVGARNASALGLKFTRMIAQRMAEAGLLVVSGLARGIDTAAHETTLKTGTVAVIAGGIDHFYPPENEKLQRAIMEMGLLITEMVPGMAPKAEHFPRRNRIISGMSRAVIVVEAAMKSGSLITARLANEQGREVFAVPGSPLDPRSQGTNKLIKEGANILTSAEDVIEVLSAVRPPSNQVFLEPPENDLLHEPEIAPGDRERILSLLSPTETPTDDIIRESGVEPHHVMAILLELEVAGRAIRQSGGTVALKS